MKSCLFSNKTKGFYPIKLLDFYKSANAMPDDAVEITDDEHMEFIGAAPAGCYPAFNETTLEMEWRRDESIQIMSAQKSVSLENRQFLKRLIRPGIERLILLQCMKVINSESDIHDEEIQEITEYLAMLGGLNITKKVEWPKIPASLKEE